MFEDPETEQLYEMRWIGCNWNKTWTPYDSLDPCKWVACINPPDPPPESGMVSNYDGVPIEFFNTSSYSCASDDTYFEHDRDAEDWNITCKEDGSWELPVEWPVCIASVNCSDPPTRPGSGTWEWDGGYGYGNVIEYTCGPYGNFLSSEGQLYETALVECQWNRTWSMPQLDPCQATACQTMPSPPKASGLIDYSTTSSEEARYNPPLPTSLTMPPGASVSLNLPLLFNTSIPPKSSSGGICLEGKLKLLVVGTIPTKSKKNFEAIVTGRQYHSLQNILIETLIILLIIIIITLRG